MKPFRYATMCSGINAPAVAWQSLGWEEVFCSEIEPFPCAVLAHHHPHVPNYGDLTQYATWTLHRDLDLAIAGTPCQGFSVAGLCAGLDDPRSKLSITYIEWLARNRPRWFVWENVPGVLSAAGGRDFATILGGFTGREVPVPAGGWQDSGILEGIDSAYSVAWRILDAQYVTVDTHPRAVPQRRRRVFVVGHLGARWQRPAAVLFERESLRGDPAPRRTAGEGTAGTLSARAEGGGGLGTDFECGGVVVPVTSGDECQNLLPVCFDETQITSKTNRSQPQPGGPSHALASGARPPALAYAIQERAVSENPATGPDGKGWQEEVAFTAEARQTPQAVALGFRACGQDGFEAGPVAPPIAASDGGGAGAPSVLAFPAMLSGTQAATTEDVAPVVQSTNPTAVAFDLRGREGGAQFEGPHETANVRAANVRAANVRAANGGSSRSYVAAAAVRRLTPRECERLQGFPDDYTLIEVRGKPAADGPRYKALGNSKAINVVRWIGQRIALVDSISNLKSQI